MLPEERHIQNPWWREARAIERDQHIIAIHGMPYRFTPPLLDELMPDAGDVFTLRGPRQVGKTTTLKLLIQKLLQALVPPTDIFYLSCEAIESFKELHSELTDYLKDRTNRRAFVFIDEVSFVPSWQRAVLGIANAGLLRHASLILTGSNARDLKQSSERLPGRRGKGKDLQLFPLSLTDLKKLACFQKFSFHEILELYYCVGGFPRAIAEFATLGIVTDDTYEIYRNWIIGDASRYHLRQETLKHILYRTAETLASRMTWPKLIEDSPVRSHETALEYIEHLQDAFLCHVHYSYDPNRNGPSFQKARKIYFIDPLLYGIALSWREGVTNVFAWMKKRFENPEFKGRMLESIVVNHAARLYPPAYYWYSAKEKKEIDLVLPRFRKGRDPALFDIKLTRSEPFRAMGGSVGVLTPESMESFLT